MILSGRRCFLASIDYDQRRFVDEFRDSNNIASFSRKGFSVISVIHDNFAEFE
jgi:hypothetical protein